MLLLFTSKVVKRKGKILQNSFINKCYLSFTILADFETVKSSLDSDSTDDLDRVYALEDIEDDEDKTESPQTYHA